MDESPATTSAMTSIIDAGHFAPVATNVPNSAVPFRKYYASIGINRNEYRDGNRLHQMRPFWRGVIDAFIDGDYVAVAIIRAPDDSSASRLLVIKQLRGVAGRRGYRLHGFEDRTTGNRIQEREFSTLANLESQMPYD
jgi:hypothetical protein